MLAFTSGHRHQDRIQALCSSTWILLARVASDGVCRSGAAWLYKAAVQPTRPTATEDGAAAGVQTNLADNKPSSTVRRRV